MKPLAFILSAVIFLFLPFLPSCEKETTEKELDSLKDFFRSELLITPKDEKISFIFSDGEIEFLTPDLLKGSKIFLDGDKITSDFHGYEISLPEDFIKSISELYYVFLGFEKDDFSDLKSENGEIIYGECTFNPNDGFFTLKTENKEYILIKRNDKPNEKNSGNS